MKYDFAVVGSGLFGSVFAYEATKRGYRVLVLDKRSHIGGNCYTENIHDIHVHKYGPHIWHTTSKKIHDYMCQFCEFNNFSLRTKVNYNNKIFSFPINLFTLYQLWGISTPEEAKIKLDSVKINVKNPQNLEDWMLSQVGEEIYETFIKGYTTKQWGRTPDKLPSSIIKRLPIRLNFNDRFYGDDHVYEGIPIGGYTRIFDQLLQNCDLKLNTDFFEDKKNIENNCNKIIYTGPIDKFFNYDFGRLEYRSLKFEHSILDQEDFQGNAIINYTSMDVPWTRIVEHKHFDQVRSNKTIITKEFPELYNGSNEPFYPVGDDNNKKILKIYNSEVEKLEKYYFGGRLATYNYYDMHQVVASALALVNKIL